MSMKISPDLDCILWLHALSQVVGKSAYGIMAGLRRASDKCLRFSRLMCKFWSHKILGSYNLCNAFPVAAYFCNHFQGSLFFGVLNLRGSPNVLEKFWKRGVHDSGLGTLWMKFHIWNWCLWIHVWSYSATLSLNTLPKEYITCVPKNRQNSTFTKFHEAPSKARAFQPGLAVGKLSQSSWFVNTEVPCCPQTTVSWR